METLESVDTSGYNWQFGMSGFNLIDSRKAQTFSSHN